MEMEIMYPEIIIFSLIIALLFLLVKRKEKNFKKGVIVANTKYVKNTTYYKNILIKYKVYSILIKITCILIVLISAVLTSRYYTVYNSGEEINNRDIVLCMDISLSVNDLNKSLIDSIKTTVSNLKTERFGVVVFDSMPLSIIPLTTDYNYVLSTLDEMKKSLNTKYNPFNTTGSFDRDYLYAGVRNEDDNNERGYSLVGDGLSYCASSFNNKTKRTKIIILTTDNEVVGNQIVTLDEAKDYCKLNNIHVFSIGTKDIYDENKEELVSLSSETDAEYYDFKNYSTNDIVKRINGTEKSSIIKTNTTYIRDFPEKILPFLLILLPILFVLEWRIRI